MSDNKSFLKKIFKFFRIQAVPLLSGLVLIAAIVAATSFFKHYRILFKSQANTTEVANKPEIKSLKTYAQEIVQKCSDATYKPGCYEEEVPKLMDYISMTEAFEVTKSVQDEDSSYAYCHVLGHKLSSRETAKDPENWKDVIAMCPTGVCSNGCIHGAFQERFREESLTDEQIIKYKTELSDVCEARDNWHPTNLEQATCYHALGHLLMYITRADINKSTTLCQELGVKENGKRNYSQLCYDGAFMQIFQPLETEDFALVEGKQPKLKDMADFCEPYVGAMREPCWAESWPLVRSEILTPKGVVKFCTNSLLLTESDQHRCFTGMFYIYTAQVQLNSAKVTDYCNGIIPSRSGLCFANGASRMIETDFRNIKTAANLCSAAKLDVAREQCFSSLLSLASYDFHPDSPERSELCNVLPEPWKSKCQKN
jgi:hypothetical protein